MLGVQHNLAFIVEDAALHLPLPRNRPSFWPRQIEKSPVNERPCCRSAVDLISMLFDSH